MSSLTADSSVGALIAELMPSTDRELRAALSHVDAELGTMPLRNVRARHVDALLDDLRRAGLSERREAAVVEALHSLFALAIARRLVATDPTGPAEPPPVPETATAMARTPTMAMVALGARVAVWTTVIVTVGFAALLLALIAELG